MTAWQDTVLNTPELSQADLEAVRVQMRLNPFDENRRKFLQTLDNVDVSACPGSGKTTLAVAKVLALHKKWKSTTRGMLILSHTNVAKDEIINRTRQSLPGRTVSTYPHFIGTIHSFVTRFLTSPYVRSKIGPIKFIDDDFVLRYREEQIKLIGTNQIRSWLHKNPKKKSALKLTQTSAKAPFGLNFANTEPEESEAYKSAANIVWQSIRRGFFCHDEIFPFALDFIKEHRPIVEAIRWRFPFVLIDEMQDTSDIQFELLNALFPLSCTVFTIQRIGDPNQDIFSDELKQESEPSNLFCFNPSNQFPVNDSIRIADSHRLNPEVANMANCFTIRRVGPEGLIGRRNLEPVVKPAFFLFSREDVYKVIPAFAKLCTEVLPHSELTVRKIAAVGQVEKLDESPKDTHMPKSIAHYHPTPADLSSNIKRATTLYDALQLAWHEATNQKQLHGAVESIATMVLQYINRQQTKDTRIYTGSRNYLRLRRWIAENNADSEEFTHGLLELFASDSPPMGKRADYFIAIVEKILHHCLGNKLNKVDDFFEIPKLDSFSPPNEGPTRKALIRNLYQHRTLGDPEFDIELSTIHSVKGETHLATLLLDTYYHGHFIEHLKDYFTRAPSKTSMGKRVNSKIRLSYVAMTRPTHLLAVAAVQDSLGECKTVRDFNIKALEKHGWRVIQI